MVFFDDFDLFETCEEYYTEDVEEFYYDDFDIASLSPEDKAELDALFGKQIKVKDQ